MGPVLRQPSSLEVVAGLVLADEGELFESVPPAGFGRGGGAGEQLPAQEVSVVLQECQVLVAEEFGVLVLDLELLGRVPVDDLWERDGGKLQQSRKGGYIEERNVNDRLI